jgi:hypothetical protein
VHEQKECRAGHQNFKKMMDVKSPKRFSNFYLVSLIIGLASKQFREKATPNTNFFV